MVYNGIKWEIPSRHGWFRGTSISGNFHPSPSHDDLMDILDTLHTPSFILCNFIAPETQPELLAIHRRSSATLLTPATGSRGILNQALTDEIPMAWSCILFHSTTKETRPYKINENHSKYQKACISAWLYGKLNSVLFEAASCWGLFLEGCQVHLKQKRSVVSHLWDPLGSSGYVHQNCLEQREKKHILALRFPMDIPFIPFQLISYRGQTGWVWNPYPASLAIAGAWSSITRGQYCGESGHSLGLGLLKCLSQLRRFRLRLSTERGRSNPLFGICMDLLSVFEAWWAKGCSLPLRSQHVGAIVPPGEYRTILPGQDDILAVNVHAILWWSLMHCKML